jgi:phosphoglycolate phosphatase-like HAD superfamily hydrolase
MIDRIMFDVDGVLLREERYFDGSALTVWELLSSPAYLGLPLGFTPAPSETQIRQIRRDVFQDDKNLNFLKSRGINSNWDMVFLSFSFQWIRALQALSHHDRNFVVRALSGPVTRELIRETGERLQTLSFQPDYSAFYDDLRKGPAEKHELLIYLNTVAFEKTGIRTDIFARTSELWQICQNAFQEWYLGDAYYRTRYGHDPTQPGKRGFLFDEIPILPKEELQHVLQTLKAQGFSLGIGTGRPTLETRIPLQALGLLEWFDENRIVTADDVLDAEAEFPEWAPLAKPHPFTYVKGIAGRGTSNRDVLCRPLPLPEGPSVLIVGDSLADLIAAEAIGAHFAATLTGLSGEKARTTFEARNTRFICRDVRGILEVVETLRKA